jgi:UDP-2,3-diacylglucosamine hydrolase
VIERLFQLKHEGIRICLCEGNHDFYLADHFTGKSGFEVYPGDAEFDLEGRRTFVSHGDTVDQENRRYLALRRFLRSPLIDVLRKHLPLKLLWGIARFSSEMSQEMSPTSQKRLEAVMHRFAADKYREGWDAVILGHCHRAVLRQETIDGRLRTFALLGDWIVHDSFLLYDNGRFTMKRFESAA